MKILHVLGGRTAVVLGLAGAIGLSWTAAAAAMCNPGRANVIAQYAAGMYKAPPSGVCYTGVLATIEPYDPYWYDVAPYSRELVRLYNPNGYYGELGWTVQSEQDPDVAYVEASLSTPNSGGEFDTYLFDGDGGNTFKLTSSGNAFHFFEDGTNIYTFTGTGYNGCRVKEVGRIYDEGFQMFGGYNNHVSFTSSQLYNGSGWVYLDGATYNDNSTWFGSTKVSSTQDDIWDKYCS